MPMCRFCFDNKIPGPHDHFLRKTKDPNSEVMCPFLLKTQCQTCFKYGHTKKYCKNNKPSNKQTKCVEVDSDGFTSVRLSKPKNNFVKETSNIQKISNAFDVLMIDNVCVAKTNDIFSRPAGMSWADWCEDEE